MQMQQGKGALNPEYVAKVEFNLARRGYEPTEVRSLLREVARNLAALHAREADLRQQLAAAEQAPPAEVPDVAELDEAALTAVLGEKTTQVLEAAREAASDIHRRAVEKARVLVDQATEDAQRIRAESESTLRSARDRAEEMERKADQRAKHLVRNAESEAGRARTEADAVLAATRTRASEIEAEAEKTASAATSSAGDHAARARAKAETLLTTARADTEAQESETQGRVSLLLRETEERIAALRAEADADIARGLSEAEADAERIVAEADARAKSGEEEGRERGRRLVAEAMTAREEVLRDLARRRRAANVQLAQLRVGRDRLLEAYAVVRATADQATDELVDVVSEAKLAAEAVADERVGNEPDMTLEQLEAAFGLDRLDEITVLGEDRAQGDETGDPDEEAGEPPEVDAEAEDDVVELTDVETASDDEDAAVSSV